MEFSPVALLGTLGTTIVGAVAAHFLTRRRERAKAATDRAAQAKASLSHFREALSALQDDMGRLLRFMGDESDPTTARLVPSQAKQLDVHPVRDLAITTLGGGNAPVSPSQVLDALHEVEQVSVHLAELQHAYRPEIGYSGHAPLTLELLRRARSQLGVAMSRVREVLEAIDRHSLPTERTISRTDRLLAAAKFKKLPPSSPF